MRIAIVTWSVVAGLSAWVAGAPGTVRAESRQLYTNTAAVEGLLVDGNELWVATRGGLERYHLPTQRREQLLTTEAGLPSNFVMGVGRDEDGLFATLAGSRCRLAPIGHGRAVRIAACESWPSRIGSVPATGRAETAPTGELFRGARITARASWQGRAIVGTATAGVWLDDVDLTPVQTICSNHVVAMASYGGRTWFGTFDEGLCSLDRAGWQRAAGPFRMINDLLVVGEALYVASSEGLFVTHDGETFLRVAGITDGVADLAYDEEARATLAVTNTTLWTVFDEGRGASTARNGARKKPLALFRPGGARSLQAVAAGHGAVWLASEDRGAMRLVGKRRDRVEIYDALAGLPSSWAIDVGVDTTGTAYVGTLRHGVVAIRDGQSHRIADGAAWTLAVTPSRRGGVWVGTQDGLVRVAEVPTVAAGDPRPNLRHNLLQNQPEARLLPEGVAERGAIAERLERPPHPSVHAVFESGNELWVATEGGTLRIEP